MDISELTARGRAGARRACVATPDDPSADLGDLTDRCISPAAEEVRMDDGVSLLDAADPSPSPLADTDS